MKIIIAGDGKVGSTLAKQLSAEGYDLTLIDAKSRVLEASEERYDIMAVQGNCAEMEVLDNANIREADLLIAVTNADEVNLLCCMLAHGMNSKIHTIARVRNPEYTKQVYEMRELFKISMIINPEARAATEIERLIKYPGFLKRETFAKGRVEIVELRIDENSKLCNLMLNELVSVVKCSVLVCTVLRDGKAITPNGYFTLQENDRIFVTGSPDNLTLLLKNLGIITHKAERVMICGGGKISYYLADALAANSIAVTIIEKDMEKCIQIARLLPDADIINGDASSEFRLDSEGIAECDALVTLTGSDEMNAMISLYANSCGVPQIITKIAHIDNGTLLNSLPIGSVVSPRQLSSNAIVRYVRALRNQAGAARAIHYIADGQAEAIEFVVDEHTLHCGEPLKKLRIKKNVLVASITSGIRNTIPNGDSVFYKGNTVIVVTSSNQVIYSLNDIFE